MKKIIWLASYPKSGNTWCRIFLTNVMNPGDDIVINKLIAPIISSRPLYDRYLCTNSTELTNEELDIFTPYIIRTYAAEINEVPSFLKIHDAFTYNTDNEARIAADVSIGSVYIVRNPLDVAVSFAHHSATTIDTIIERMNDESYAMDNAIYRRTSRVRQPMMSWSSHVLSWLEQKEMPVLLIRYEDMLDDAVNTFKKIVEFCGLQITDDTIIAAIERSRFSKIKEQEEKEGFNEKNPDAVNFFRSGISGDWRTSLTSAQVERIINKHHEVMKRLGYIDSSLNPVI